MSFIFVCWHIRNTKQLQGPEMSNKESKHDNIRQHLKDYEKKTKSDENLGEENKNVKTENQEIWRRLQWGEWGGTEVARRCKEKVSPALSSFKSFICLKKERRNQTPRIKVKISDHLCFAKNYICSQKPGQRTPKNMHFRLLC